MLNDYLRDLPRGHTNEEVDAEFERISGLITRFPAEIRRIQFEIECRASCYGRWRRTRRKCEDESIFSDHL